MSTILQTGEQLPEYDDGPADGVNVNKMLEWLAANRAGWRAAPRSFDATVVRDVLAALQTVGDATLVKNGTYRLMRRDGADIERLAAHLSRRGHAELVVNRDGNPVTAVIALLTPLD